MPGSRTELWPFHILLLKTELTDNESETLWHLRYWVDVDDATVLYVPVVLFQRQFLA